MSDLSREELIKFFEAGRLKQECAACGVSAGWIIPSEEHEKTVGLFSPRPADGGYVMPGGITPAVMLVCKNCGHIRLYSEVYIAQLIKGERGNE